MIKFNRNIDNTEIVSKIMNSVARKYDCRVTYDDHTRRSTFTGDERFKSAIAAETAGILESGTH